MSEVAEQFYKLQTRKDVAQILQIRDSSLRYFLYGIGTDNLYDEFEIPKRTGGSREIAAPKKKWRTIQRKLADVLVEVYSPKKSTYGFIKDRNHILGADKHKHQRVVLNIDLKDFFGQIHFGRVMGLFMAKPYSVGREAAVTIAQIACYKGRLPQGAPSSPIITNMICRSLDTSLIRFATKNHLIYTRYADDISFSTHESRFSNDIVHEEKGTCILGESLLSIFETNSLEVNPEKIFIRYRFQRQEVTGLVVNKFTNVRREYIRQIRSMLYSCKKSSPIEAAVIYVNKGYCKNSSICIIANKNERTDEEDEKLGDWFKQVLHGKIDYLRNVRGGEDSYFLKYAKELNVIFDEEIFIIPDESLIGKSKRWSFIIERHDEMRSGSGFLLKQIGIVTSYHVVEDNSFYKVMHQDGSIEKEAVSLTCNEVYSNKELDCIIFRSHQTECGYELAPFRNIETGCKVKVVGFPQYKKGDSVSIISTEVTGKSSFMKKPLYTVNNTLRHGMSGGVVVDEKNQVVGMVKAGIESWEDEETTSCGFIPIWDIVDDYKTEIKH